MLKINREQLLQLLKERGHDVPENAVAHERETLWDWNICWIEHGVWCRAAVREFESTLWLAVDKDGIGHWDKLTPEEQAGLCSRVEEPEEYWCR